MAFHPISLQHHVPFEPFIWAHASGESSPAMNASAILELSPPGAAAQVHLERRLEMRKPSASSPTSHDGKPSLLICLNEAQSSTSPCNSSSRSCCSALEASRQELRPMTPEELERSCADHIAAAAAAPEDTVSSTTHSVSRLALKESDIWATPPSTPGLASRTWAANGTESTSTPSTEDNLQRERAAQHQGIQRPSHWQELSWLAQPASLHSFRPVGGDMGQAQQMPHLKWSQLQVQQWKMSRAHCCGMPASSCALSAHTKQPQSMQQYPRQLLPQPLQQLQQTCFGHNHFQQHTKQPAGQLDRTGCLPKSVLQNAAAAPNSMAVNPWAPSIQAFHWSLFSGSWT